MCALERILRVGTLPGTPGAWGRDLWERRHRQQRELPESGSGLMLSDRHRRLRRASAGRLRGGTPDRDRPVQWLTGAAWEPQRHRHETPGWPKDATSANDDFLP